MPEEVPEAGRLTVLLSYSRDDLNFADQLEAALQSHKYDVAIDRQGISGGENWKARLGGLIRDADTVIFVLSPSSAASELCKWEVEEASRLGKRIIPVPCRPLGDTTVPPQLSALEYILFIQRRGCPAPVSERGLRALCRRWTPTSIGYASTLDYCSARANGIPRVAPSLGFSSGTASPRPKRGRCVGQRTPPSRLHLHYEFVRRARKPRREGKTPSASSLNKWKQRRPTEPRRWRNGRRLRSAGQNKHGAWCGGR